MKSAPCSWRDKALCASVLAAVCVGAAYMLKQRCPVPTARAATAESSETQEAEKASENCLLEVVRQEGVIIDQLEQTQQLNKGLEDVLHALRDGEAVLAGSPVEHTY